MKENSKHDRMANARPTSGENGAKAVDIT